MINPPDDEALESASKSRSAHKLTSLIAKRPGNESECQLSLEQAENGEDKHGDVEKP